jgi:hypothetical protein
MRFLLLLCLLLASTLNAQSSPYPQWGNLEPGPYAVGVRVINTFDYSRTYWPPRDWRGQERPGESARPMQIVIWYPVDPTTSAGGLMTYGDYLDFWATELGARSDSLKAAKVREYRQGPFAPSFPNGIADADWARITGVRTAARDSAPPARARFPLLIQAGIGGASAQSVMHEFLASHGYVIASVPFLNTSPAWHDRGEWTAAALDEEVRDIGFVLSQVRELEFVDRSKLAVIGMGAHAGLNFQMRTGLLDAIAMLDVTFPESMRRLPYYDPAAVRIPILDLPNTEYPRDDESILDSLRYSERFLVRFRELPHVDFYQFTRVGRPERAREFVNYETISRYALNFLDATLKNDSTARRTLLAGAEVAHRAAMPAAPTEAEFLTLVRYQGMEPAVALYREVKARDPGARMFSIDGLRTGAFFLMRDRGIPQATTGLELIAEAYPDSAKAHQFLGDWYARGQMRAEARQHYQAALEKLPSDRSLTAAQRQSMESAIRENLIQITP